jgi:hypothetical protein
MEPKNIPPYLPLVVWGVKRDMNKQAYRFCLKKKSKNVNTIASSESFVRPLKAEETAENGDESMNYDDRTVTYGQQEVAMI